jgi:uncharacterized membrane protein
VLRRSSDKKRPGDDMAAAAQSAEARQEEEEEEEEQEKKGGDMDLRLAGKWVIRGLVEMMFPTAVFLIRSCTVGPVLLD